MNLTFIWDNQADDATLSGGSWLSGLPLTNLQTRKLYNTARSTNDANASTIIRVDLGATKVIGAVILAVTNLSSEATARIKVYSDAYTTETFSSGVFDVFRPVSGGGYYWGVDPVWTGSPSEVLLSRYSRDLVYLFATADIQTQRYLQIELFDDTNPAGYVEAGRLMVGPYWETEYHYEHGAGHSVVDLSVGGRTLGGGFTYDARSKLRNFAFSLAGLELTEAFTKAYDMDMALGTTGEVYICPSYNQDFNFLQVSFLGVLKELDALTARTYNFYGKSYRIEELK